MLDEKSTRIQSTKEETYFSKWIDEDKADEFVKSMKPKIDTFKSLQKEGYRVEVNISRHDSDCFGERDVVIMCIDMSAVKSS